MSSAERRSFFRVHSDIVLDFHPVDTFTLNNSRVEDEFPEEQKTLDLFSEFRRLDKEAAPHLGSVAETNRALADYLKILNKKLDLIAQQSLAADYASRDVRPTHVNLSEGGLAFNSSKALYKDSHLALRVMFLSDYSSVASFARVVRCEGSGDDNGEKSGKKSGEQSDGQNSDHNGHYKVACKFLCLGNIKQEILARHIMQAQLNAKRRSQLAQ